MANISDLAPTLSQYPTSRDVFTDWADGNRRVNCTNAEIVNRIEGTIVRVQQHVQHTVRVAENAFIGGNRKRLLLGNVSYNDRTRDNWHYTFTLTADQLGLLGGSLIAPGVLYLPSAYRYDDAGDGSHTRLRSYVKLLPPNEVEVFYDHIDQSGKVKPGYYYVRVAIFGK